MMRIGLTGGIGSGKSTLAGMLARLGVPVLDLDAVGRELHADPDCRAELVSAFGEDILAASGAVDRGALGRLCFADAGKTAQLGAIMHPRIHRFEAEWTGAQAAPYVLIEASVLIESGGVARMDAVIVVLADIEIRRRRVMSRPGMDAARFDAIVARQCSDDQRRVAADFVVDNNADLESLRQQATDLHRQLLAEAAK